MDLDPNINSSVSSSRLVGRYSEQDGVELTGTPLALRYFASLLISGSGILYLRVPQAPSAPYDGFLTSIEVRHQNDLVLIQREGEKLLISGSSDKLTVFAQNINWIADQSEENGNDNHIHIEYYKNHPYLIAFSTPLIVNAKMNKE